MVPEVVLYTVSTAIRLNPWAAVAAGVGEAYPAVAKGGPGEGGSVVADPIEPSDVTEAVSPARRADHELARRAGAGDGEAFAQIVDAYADDLYRLAYSLVGSDADAKDVVQETFLGALQRIGSFAGRSSIKTWLMRILFNQASKLRRSRRVRKAMSLGIPGEPSTADPDPRLHTRSGDDAVGAKADVQAMLDTLSEDHRQVIVLREIERLSYDEIAGVLSVPVGTVESRLYRARQELKQRFADYAL